MPERERGRKGFPINPAPSQASKKTGTKHLLSPVGSPEASIKRHSPSRNQPSRSQTVCNTTTLPTHQDSLKDKPKQLSIWSTKKKGWVDVQASFVVDLSESWISISLVEDLGLKHNYDSKCKPQYCILGKRTVRFKGTTQLQWSEKVTPKSNWTPCRVVDDRTSDFLFLPLNSIPPETPTKKDSFIPESPPSMLPSPPQEPPLPLVPSTDPPLKVSAGSFDGSDTVLDDDTYESKAADLYMSSLKSSILQCLQKTENKLRGEPEIKIAVLDTGVDSKHPFIDEAITRSKRIVCLKSFVQEDPSTEDEFGHGTHITNILLTIAPKAQIYVAKVSKTGDIPLTHKIDEAIMWAVGHNVDIITMSFGLEEEHGGMQKAIIEAYSKNILMFAAASNEGGNRIVTYPARKEQVICIYATDGKGEPYRSNPTPIGNSYRFATLGEGVKSAWPKGLKKGVAPEQRMTGTSFATPIAAGIAACLLEFALVHGMPDNSYSSLRTRQGMQAVFGKLLVDVRKELHYIHPWRLFSESREPLDILLLMKDTLTHSPN